MQKSHNIRFTDFLLSCTERYNTVFDYLPGSAGLDENGIFMIWPCIAKELFYGFIRDISYAHGEQFYPQWTIVRGNDVARVTIQAVNEEDEVVGDGPIIRFESIELMKEWFKDTDTPEKQFNMLNHITPESKKYEVIDMTRTRGRGKNAMIGIRRSNMEMCADVLTWMEDNIPEGSTILEFGSGKGTDRLSKNYKMLSIEEDENWVNKFDSKYLHCPLKNKWYNVDLINEFIEDKDYDAIFVDGPAGAKREKLYTYLQSGRLKLKTDCIIVFDDTERKDDCTTALKIASFLKKSYKSVNYSGNGKKFGYILPIDLE